MTKVDRDDLKCYLDTMQGCNFEIQMILLDANTTQQQTVLAMSRTIHELVRAMHRQIDFE